VTAAYDGELEVTFVVGGGEVGGDSAPLSTTQLELSFAEDGTLESLAMEFELDFRTAAVDEALGADGCELMMSFGVACEPCSGNGEPECLALRVEDVVATSSAEALAIIGEDECHPDCADCDVE
jgi:hypothetical protein